MATVHFHGEPAHTIGDLPALGTTLPNISLVDATLADITNDTIAGTRVIFNVFPSIDTGVCATSVRRFNEEAAGLDNTTVVCVSHDLPFALGRFCGAEGINNVVVGSAFRSSFRFRPHPHRYAFGWPAGPRHHCGRRHRKDCVHSAC